MAKVFVSDTHLTNIANAVREKNGKTTKYKPSEIPNAIKAIEVTEDLSSELTTQNNLLTTQTSKLSSVVTALQGKASGGSGGVTMVSTPYTGEETQLILNHGALPLASDVVYKILVGNSSGENIIEETLSFQYLGRPDDMYDHYAADNGGNIWIEVIGNLSDGGANTGTEIFFDGFLITVDSTEATSVTICKL